MAKKASAGDPSEQNNPASSDAPTGGESDILSSAKQAVGDVAEQVRSTATSKADQQRESVASGLSSVADAFRRMGEGLQQETQAPIAGYAANLGKGIGEQVDSLARYFQGKDVGQIVDDTENFARRNPVLFLGSAFAIGLAATRFLKSSQQSASLRRGGYGVQRYSAEPGQVYGDYTGTMGGGTEGARANYPAGGTYSGGANYPTSGSYSGAPEYPASESEMGRPDRVDDYLDETATPGAGMGPGSNRPL